MENLPSVPIPDPKVVLSKDQNPRVKKKVEGVERRETIQGAHFTTGWRFS
jgi:hypothetical protein